MLDVTPAPLQQLLRERKRGHTLPAAFYRDPDIFAADMGEIVKKRRIYVGVEPDVAEPGEVMTVAVAGTSILTEYEFSAGYRCSGAILRLRNPPKFSRMLQVHVVLPKDRRDDGWHTSRRTLRSEHSACVETVPATRRSSGLTSSQECVTLRREHRT
jgi:hypothetical protein